MLLFSEYNRSLKNISISQPIVDVDIEDTNSIISYSKVIISADSKTTYLSMMRNKQVFL